MTTAKERLFNYLVRIDEKLLANPKRLILVAGIACVLSLNYTIENLGINTDTTQMLSSELPFQQNRNRLIQAFPQDDQAFLIVVDSATAVLSSRVLAYLGKQLRKEQNYVKSVYIPGEGAYFDHQGLLFLQLEDIEELADNLAKAQPFISKLSEDNNINGLFSIIRLALTSKDVELPIEIVPLLNRLREAIRAAIGGAYYRLDWQKLMSGQAPDLLTTQRFVLMKPQLDFNALMPAEKSYQVLHAILNRAEEVFPQARIRLTGEIALEHEELESVARSSLIASIFSILLVSAALLVGLRSMKLMIATVLCLIMGLIFTAGFATLAVGHLNLISIAFAVLYIGLGVDYAIHFCLRYREMIQQKLPSSQALSNSVRMVAPSITLCTITTAAGFYAFVPTSYLGVSELGIIAGTGMFIGLAVTLTILPAILTIMPLNAVSVKQRRKFFPESVYRFPIRFSSIIKWSSLVLSVAALGLLTKISFDFNPVNLRDPNSESVSTFKDLLKTKETSPMTLTVLANGKGSTLAKAERLESLKSVETAITIFDFVPDNQEEKLAVVEELALLLGFQLSTFPKPSQGTIETSTAALKEFLRVVIKSLRTKSDESLTESLNQLRKDLEEYLTALENAPADAKKDMLDTLQSSLLDSLPDTMNSLLKGLDAEIVTVDDLPKDLSARWLNETGIYRIMVFPSKDLNHIDTLREFISDVQQLEPNATDLPAIYLESGREIVKAFQKALIGALLAIIVVLMVIQRKIIDTLLVLLPLLMATLFTCAVIVLCNNPFNYANIIAIPLLFGLGVDSGIHIIHRLRSMPTQDGRILQTSTARAIFFSGLTTLFSFVSLAFTSHLGLASMGQLLAIGITFLIFCTLIVLPAFAVKNKVF